MVPVKDKSTSRHRNDGESVCPTKKAPTTKFKIYSENGKAAANRRATVGCSISRKSIPPKPPIKETDHKGPVNERRGKLESLAKTNVPRRALADVSNSQGSGGNEAYGSSKLRYSMTLVRRTSSTSSGHNSEAKGKTNVTLDVDGHQSSRKGDTKSGRASISSSLQKSIGQPRRTLNDRLATKKSLQVTRKSYPILRTSSLGPATKIKETAQSQCSSKSTYGFLVKPRVGGTEVPRAGDAKSKFRLNDKSGVKASNVLPRVDSRRRLEKSIKQSTNISLRVSSAKESIKSRSICSLDKSQSSSSSKRDEEVAPSKRDEEATYSCYEAVQDELVNNSNENLKPKKCDVNTQPKPGKRDEETASSAPEGSMYSCYEAVQDKLVNNSNENLNPKNCDVNTQKKSSRRRSYTSGLISNSKLQEDNNIYDQANPLEVADYVDEIYLYYWAMEAQGMVVPDYMSNQTEVTAQMRAILVNWLVEVHYKFDLMPETLYLTVALLDRYLSVVAIKKNEMQLVGLTSLLLASKYEDFWHPRVRDLISVSAESYTRRQMLQMEKDVLTKLKFRFNLPTAYVFMLRFLKASQADTKVEHLAFYLIELSLVEYEALKLKPSLLCAAAVYVTRSTLGLTPTWTPLLSHHARYSAPQIRECAEMVLGFHKAASAGQLKVIHEKYSKSEFSKVAAIKPLDTLPS